MDRRWPVVPWLALVLVAPMASADGFNLASVSYELVPKAELKLTGLEEDEIATTATTTTLKFAIPILLSGRDRVLLNFFTLRNLHQSYRDVPGDLDSFRPVDLYAFKYGLVFREVLGERWSVATLVQPALLSDLEDVGSRHLSLRAGFIFEKKSSETLTYGFGVGYSDDFGGQAVLPVARLDWHPAPRWTVHLDLPQKFDLWRAFGGRFRIGLAAKATGGRFRIGQNTLLESGRSVKDGFVKYSIFNVGPAVRVPLLESMDLTINGGTSAYRRYEVVDSDDRVLIDSSYESSLFLKTTLTYRVGGKSPPPPGSANRVE